MSYRKYDPQIAARYGLEEAILLEALRDALTFNALSELNQHDGRTWVRGSVQALSSYFEEFTPSQIRRAMESLEKQGLILKAKLSQNPLDHTAWYALPEEPVFAQAEEKEANNWEKFWDAYPRREDKRRALSAFANLSKSEQVKAIADCAVRYVGVAKKFIPLPSTYIHGKRWEDEAPDDKGAAYSGSMSI